MDVIWQPVKFDNLLNWIWKYLDYFPALGWNPVIVNSEAEFDELREGHKDLGDIRTFWVGGSTNRPHRSSMSFTDYLPHNEGILAKCILSHWKHSGTNYTVILRILHVKS